jgi:hypothetical protein
MDLVLLREVSARGAQMAMAEPNFEDLQANNQSFAALAISAGSFPLAVTGEGEPLRARVSMASRQFFEVMGVQPLTGRTFLPEEEKYGGPVAALVSYGYWQKMLGRRADFSAAKLNVDGVSCNIVGVMPPGFDYPAGTEVWISYNTDPPNTSRTAHNLPVIGRLGPGVSLTQASAELSVIGKRLRQTYGEKTDAVDFALIPLQTHMTRNVREGLWLLLGAGSLLLMMACANYANLLLAQFSTRQREFTVRAALGASRWRLAEPSLRQARRTAIKAAEESGVPEHGDPALRGADGNDPPVAFATGERDDRIDVVDLGTAVIRDASRPAVTAHVERVDREPLRQVFGEDRELRLGVPAHEAVHEDDGGPVGLLGSQARPDDLDVIGGQDREHVRGDPPTV